MKAAFLIRCSTKNQDLDRQTRDLTRLANSMGYEVPSEELVFGEKITGKDDVTKKNRESIDRLLKAAKEQKFDVVLVSEVSRMSRDPASGRIYVRQLINMGMPVYFRDIDKWTIDPTTGTKVNDAEIVIGAAFDAAWKYIRSLKTQIASGRRNELDNNQISVGQPFFGYTRYGGKDKSQKNRWIIDETEAEAVRAIFEEYLKEGSTLKSTALAITAKFGESLNKRFTVGTIEHILTFESYATGIKTIMLADPDIEDEKEREARRERFDVEIPTIISKELFDLAANKRKCNRVKSEPYPKQQTFVLSKLIKCPCCGYTMTPKAKGAEGKEKAANGCYRMINGKKAMSWVCMSGVNNATTCPNRMALANEKAEPIIWGLVKKELLAFANRNNEDRERIVAELETKISNLTANQNNYTKHLESLNKKAVAAFQAYTEVLAKGDVNMTEIARMAYDKTTSDISKDKIKTTNSIEQTKEEITKLSSQKVFYSQPSLPDDIIEKAEADSTEMRKLVQEVVTKIVPYKITTFKKPQKEKGRGAGKNIFTVKNGIVLLEVYTVDGIYYILYNANGKSSIRYAYYINGNFATFQKSTNRFEIYEEGEYFVISNPDLVMDSEEVEEFASVNEFVDIAKANDWILEYQYKPEIQGLY